MDSMGWRQTSASMARKGHIPNQCRDRARADCGHEPWELAGAGSTSQDSSAATTHTGLLGGTVYDGARFRTAVQSTSRDRGIPCERS
jgi:hypothetical protein